MLKINVLSCMEGGGRREGPGSREERGKVRGARGGREGGLCGTEKIKNLK